MGLTASLYIQSLILEIGLLLSVRAPCQRSVELLILVSLHRRSIEPGRSPHRYGALQQTQASSAFCLFANLAAGRFGCYANAPCIALQGNIVGSSHNGPKKAPLCLTRALRLQLPSVNTLQQLGPRTSGCCVDIAMRLQCETCKDLIPVLIGKTFSASLGFN